MKRIYFSVSVFMTAPGPVNRMLIVSTITDFNKTQLKYVVYINKHTRHSMGYITFYTINHQGAIFEMKLQSTMQSVFIALTVLRFEYISGQRVTILVIIFLSESFLVLTNTKNSRLVYALLTPKLDAVGHMCSSVQ